MKPQPASSVGTVAQAPARSAVLDFVVHRVRRALRARKRYRYVQPRVLREGAALRIESPCCSRNIDPQGGVIDIARLRPGRGHLWVLQWRDHAQGRWVDHSRSDRLDELLDILCVDGRREFWQ